MSNFFRDFAAELFGFSLFDVPETIPLGSWVSSRRCRRARSSCRRSVGASLEVHPDPQLADDHPALQAGAEALTTRPESANWCGRVTCSWSASLSRAA